MSYINETGICMDYEDDRHVIEYPRFITKSEASRRECLMIPVPDKIRKQMKLSHYNESEFRVIIVRKETI